MVISVGVVIICHCIVSFSYKCNERFLILMQKKKDKINYFLKQTSRCCVALKLSSSYQQIQTIIKTSARVNLCEAGSKVGRSLPSTTYWWLLTFYLGSGNWSASRLIQYLLKCEEEVTLFT